MPLSESTRYKLYQPVVLTDVYLVTFPIFAAADLRVQVDGVETNAYTVSATFTDGRSDDASITLTSAVTGVDVEIFGARAPRSDADFVSNSPQLADQVQLENEKLAAVQQEQVRDFARSVKLPVSAPQSVEIGAPAAGYYVLASSADNTSIGWAPAAAAGVTFDPANFQPINSVLTAISGQGNVDAGQIADAAISATQIAANAVTTAKVADGAITESKLSRNPYLKGDAFVATSGAGPFDKAIPALVQTITLMFRATGVVSTTEVGIRVGSGGVPAVTGYTSKMVDIASGGNTLISSTDRFQLGVWGATDEAHGEMRLTRESDGGNIWNMVMKVHTGSEVYESFGEITLAGELDVVRLFTSTADFDTGGWTARWSF